MEMRQFLSFGLAEELYALPLTQIQEIARLAGVTRLPGTPAFLRGVINLRGAIVPVVDLREELGLPAQPYGKFTVVIVIEVAGVRVGLIVDRAVDVLGLSAKEIELPPRQLRVHLKQDFVSGMAWRDGQLLVLLDLDRILTDDQIGILKGASAA